MNEPARPRPATDRDHPAWRQALELAFEGLAVLEGERVVGANGPFAALLGLEPSELIGQDLGVRLAPRGALAALAGLEAGRVVAAHAMRSDGMPLGIELRRKPLGGGLDLVSMSELDDARRVSLAIEELAVQVAPFTGQAYFESLVRYLARVCQVDMAVIWELRHPQDQAFHQLAGTAFGAPLATIATPRAGSPCDDVVAHGARIYAQGVREVYTACAPLEAWQVEAYIGVPLLDQDGRPLGVLALLHTRPLLGISHIETLLAIVAPHAAAELSHQRATTALKGMASMLRDREGQLTTLIANLPGMAYRCQNDAQWTMTFVSEGCLELTGYAPDDFVGNRRVSFDALYHPEDHGRIWDEVQAALAARRPFELTYRIRDRAGRLKWIWEKGRGIFGDDGSLLFLEGLLMDVSAQKLLADQLSEHETRLQEAQQIARLGSWDWDVRTGELTWSDEHYRMLGLAPGAIAPSVDGFLSFVHPEDAGAMRQCLTQPEAMRLTPRFVRDCRIVRRDGEVRVVHARVEACFDADGRLSRIKGTVQDVTESRQAEEALRASEARYRLLAENASDMVALFSPTFVYTYASPSAQRATGYGPEELVGTHGLSQIHPDDVPRVEVAIASMRAGAEGAKVDYRYQHKDGHFVWLESSGSAILAPAGGEVVGFQISTRDVSERKRAEAELREANEELTRLGVLKDEFLSTMSHELRTPLATVQNAVAILLKQKAGPLNSDQQRFMAMIRDQGASLQRLVDDILDYQQMSRGAAPLLLVATDMRVLVEAEAEAAAAMFARHRSALTLELPIEAVPCEVDRAQMAQVIRSLLSNAAKFTPPGGSVVVRVAQAGPDVHLTVSDNGRGIPADALERIFEEFVQLDGSLTRPVGGAGLGLALCRQIVQGHGGRIWAESVLEQGTTVHVALLAGGADAMDMAT